MAYTPMYESAKIRGIEDHRPWDIIEEVRRHAKPEDILVDIGAGTARKILQLAGDAIMIFGVEPNDEMRKKAKENILDSGCTNVVLIGGEADYLPFRDNFAEIVTCMVAPYNAQEVHRVLKPGVYAIIEKMGDADKLEIKVHFGYDAQGFRGHPGRTYMGLTEEYYAHQLSGLFSHFSIRNGFWKTYYQLDELILLLEQTPTVRNFNREKDAGALQEIVETLMTDKGIETWQHRILVVAQK